jgi:hypothetical protein
VFYVILKKKSFFLSPFPSRHSHHFAPTAAAASQICKSAMASTSKETRGRNPADRFTDDILLLILSRLPAKSICRFKCVSPAWRNLISHPDYRKKLPQTLSGFFYHTYSRERESARHFTNITRRGAPLVGPSLSFLPGYSDITVLRQHTPLPPPHRRRHPVCRMQSCH